MAYIMGKAEGEGERWHGHVTAVTVAPAYRRQGLARTLMGTLEETTEKMYVAVLCGLMLCGLRRRIHTVLLAIMSSHGSSLFPAPPLRYAAHATA